MLQLRAKRLDAREHLAVAQRTQDLCRQFGTILMFNGPIDMAREAAAMVCT
ncbi:thiamine phosphate synthase [Ralstonia pseudosolanacearum]|uniref:thiamine phosphate synthase n=1 Tax=Ralstonia pseudosolanacearum TaxID=1310165 RepID=UPI00399D7221